jgi:hypothetical protein
VKKPRGRPSGSGAINVLQTIVDKDPSRPGALWEEFKGNCNVVPIANLPLGVVAEPCWIWKGGTSSGGQARATVQNGYGVIILKRESSRLPIHVLAHYIKTAEVPQLAKPKLDISHRCHKKKCYNPAHLVREGTETNGSRDYCFAYQRVDSDTIMMCPHNPSCLRAGEKVKGFHPYKL